MYIEYACYDYSLCDQELKNQVALALQLDVTNIAVHHSNISAIKSTISDSGKAVQISCPIDFPYGMLDSKNRLAQISSAIKSGASIVDIVAPSKFIINRKYDKLRDDIQNSLLLCKESNVLLRYMLEYRVFNHETLAKTCQILKSFEVNQVLPSSGMLIDDINDNLIAARYLSAKSKIQIICNGNVWNEKQAKSIIASNIYGFRSHHIPSLELFCKIIRS